MQRQGHAIPHTGYMPDTNDVTAPRLSADALQEWGQHLESVMRGIAHALNNRAAAISAVIELARDVDEEPPATGSILATELERVNELAAVVRTIGPPRGGVEAFAPRDASEEALVVLRMHAQQRDRVILIEASDAPPI